MLVYFGVGVNFSPLSNSFSIAGESEIEEKLIIFISDGPGETELWTKKEPGFVDAKLTTILTGCDFAVVAVVAVDVDAADFVDFLDSLIP